MNPSDMFCPHGECPLRGQKEAGNVVIHSQKERRYRCLCCGHTFAATKGTAYYRLRTPPATVALVVTLLAHGCPPPAVVAAFGLDARTVYAWQQRAGQQSERVHQALVQQHAVELGQVQADELWVKLLGRKLWLAQAVAVPSRLWLGGVLGARDGELIRTLVDQVRQCARSAAVLVCVDGLGSYVKQFCRAFRVALRTGAWRRPRRVLPAGFRLGQVVKSHLKRRVVGVAQRAVVGSLAEIQACVAATGGGHVINTAFIERLNGTFRSRWAPLIRRGRCLVRNETTLTAGMYLVGTVYNFCCYHQSLRVAVPSSRAQGERTPAMAAGLAAQRWTVGELLGYRVAPPRWVPPKRCGRPPKVPRGTPWKLRPHRRVLWSSTV